MGVQHRFKQTEEITSIVRLRIAERSRKVKGKIETKKATRSRNTNSIYLVEVP